MLTCRDQQAAAYKGSRKINRPSTPLHKQGQELRLEQTVTPLHQQMPLHHRTILPNI